MKFKKGQIILDRRDGEKLKILLIKKDYYHVEVIKKGNGSIGGDQLREARSTHQLDTISVDRIYVLDESSMVSEILKKYE